MASIVPRKGKYCVVYNVTDLDGERKQKWETFKTYAEAKARKTEVEYHQALGSVEIPNCRTVSELLKEYVNLYGKTVWSPSMYTNNCAMIRNYIDPKIGNLPLDALNARVMEKYYGELLRTPAVRKNSQSKYDTRDPEMVAIPTIRKIHSLLRSAFNQALKWDLLQKNPATFATVPKQEEKKREIWDAPTIFRAIELCHDERLKLCMNLAFACSLRLGEVLGLTWDVVDISEESMLLGRPSITVNKELQRVNKNALQFLDHRDIIATFPESNPKNHTILALKKPKTVTSTRKVFLPKSVAEMLMKWKDDQDAVKTALGEEYSDFNLVIAGPLGMPTEGSRIETALKKLIKANDLPKVVFHSLRHSSITYKLQLSQGDIKAVQGDSGHAQAKMVTDQYSHILDENRVTNALKIQEAFYDGKGAEPSTVAQKPSQSPTVDPLTASMTEAGLDAEQMMKLLQSPEMVNMLKMLTKNM